MTKYDPVTFDIIQNALEAIADEMFVAQRKASMSAIIYEVLDLSSSILDPVGDIAAAGAGIPAFIGVLDKAVKGILKKFPLESVKPGDLYASNDPYYGGVTHLNDMVLAAPVFADGKIVAWVANIAHWNDVGGNVPGSMSSDATEIFQEGVRIPAVKLFAEGVANEAVFDILHVNTRLPDFLRGDLWAGIAGLRIGERRVLELIEKYGADTYLAAVVDYMDLGEKRALAALKLLPAGTYDYSEEQDDGAVHKLRLTISADKFSVDLRDNPVQSGSKNSSREGSEIALQLAFKSFTDPEGPGNGGCFRPLEVITEPGTIFHVVEPGALGYYSEVEIRLFDMTLRALAHHFGSVVPAGNFASICGTVMGGKHPDTGRHYTIVEPQVGGWGGWEGHDGNSGQFSGFHGETFNCPAEIAEARYGMFVDQVALNAEPGGEGQWRGGKGIEVHYRVRGDNNFLSLGYTRSRMPPWGAAGGLDGSLNYVELVRTDGRRERYSFATNVVVNTNDVIRIRSGFSAAGAAGVITYGEDGGHATADADPGQALAFWTQTHGAWGSADSDGNAAQLLASWAGFFVGADLSIAADWRVGALAGYSRTTFDANDRNSSGASDNYHLGVYGGGSIGDVGLRAGAAYTWHDIATERQIALPGFADELDGDYQAGTLQAFAEAGYQVDIEGVTFEPFANLAYVNLNTGGYSETGGAAALHADSQTSDVTFTTLGLRASMDLAFGSTNAKLHGMVGWRHAFGDTTPQTVQAFSQGDAFKILGTPIAEDAALIEAGIDLDLAPNATLSGSYVGQIAGNAQQHGFNVRLGVSF